MLVRKSYNGAMKMEGLPLGTSQAVLSAYLVSILENEPSYSVKTGVKVVSMETRRRSCSAVVTIPRGKKKYHRLRVLLKDNPFQGKVVHLRLLDLWDAIRPALDPPAEEGETPLTGIETPQLRERTVLARSFHSHLMDLAESTSGVAMDRERGSELFQAWYQSYQMNLQLGVETANLPDRGVESAVFGALRKMGLLSTTKSGRANLMCVRSAHGTFPSKQGERHAVALASQARSEDASNKKGVIVSECPDGSVAKKKESFSFSLEIVSTDLTVELRSIVLSGPHGHHYKVMEQDLPVRLSESITVRVEATAPGIGVFRATVAMVFANAEDEVFRIRRDLAVRCGDKAMNELLAPVAPYQRRIAKKYFPLPNKSYDPPAVKQSAENPLKKLDRYSIPPHVKTLLSARAFEESVERLKSEDLTLYSKFWTSLLWASEWQSRIDIQMFDMEHAALRNSGQFLALTVPGLAEGRPSLLRGDLVEATWKNKLYKGRIRHVRQLEIALEFHASFRKGFRPAVDRIDLVRFTFSRTSYRTSHYGCKVAQSTMGKCMLFPSSEDIVVSSTRTIREQRQCPAQWPWANRFLNVEQQSAVAQVVKGALRPLPYIIFGPPGTGKTTTVVEAAYQLAKRNLKILVVAPSNNAADVLVERLAPYYPPSDMRRILAFSRPWDTVAPAVRPYAREGLSADEQRNEILLSSARIIVSTVVLAARFRFWGVPVGHFDVLCVDEAGHATELEVVAVAATLIDFDGSGQLVLAGDPKQLGPVTTSPMCQRLGLSTSYLERLMGRAVYGGGDGDDGRSGAAPLPPDLGAQLVRNYRSHPAILRIPNELFYNGALQCCGDKLATHSLAHWEHLPSKGFPVVFHSIDGDMLRESNSPSWFNPQEVQQVVQYVRQLVHESKPPVSGEEIGIVTPYARQAAKIRMALAAMDSVATAGVVVGSVEALQGQERRCIIVSTVRSEPEKVASAEVEVSSEMKSTLGFVSNGKRFNVALTRAKALLIVVGCAKVLALDTEHWLPFLRYCHENEGWAGEEWDPVEMEPADSDDDSEDGTGPSDSAESSSDEDEKSDSAASSEDGERSEGEVDLPQDMHEELYGFVHRDE